MVSPIAPATPSGGGATVVSFGSGDSGGRTQAAAQGRARNTNASPARLRAARSSVNRANISQRRKRELLRQLEGNARGNVRLGRVSDILNQLNEYRNNPRGRRRAAQ